MKRREKAKGRWGDVRDIYGFDDEERKFGRDFNPFIAGIGDYYNRGKDAYRTLY